MLGLAFLAPSAARAQTQDLFVSTSTGFTNPAISRFAGTGLGTFSTTSTTFSASSLNSPSGLAFDSRGDLFVANDNNANTITEFMAGTTPGTFGATNTFSDPSLNQPLGLAIDARGDLFAANAYGGTVTEFMAGSTPGTFGAGTTFATGVNNPAFLAFGPSVSAPVPEASTTVSLGLLLALGVGGVIVVGRRKRKA